MWNPGGSLMLCRFFLIASALGPVCGMVGMLGDAPVVLNAPSLSRLVIGAWANAAVDASSAAVDSATTNCLRMTKPPDCAWSFFGSLRPRGPAWHNVMTVQVDVAGHGGDTAHVTALGKRP